MQFYVIVLYCITYRCNFFLIFLLHTTQNEIFFWHYFMCFTKKILFMFIIGIVLSLSYKKKNPIKKLSDYKTFFFIFHFRFSVQRQIFSYTPKFICERLNHTNVLNVPKHLQTQAICPNIPAFIWALNRIAVKYVSENSPNYHIYNNTFVHIPGINHTSVVILAAKKPFHNYQIYNRIRDAIRLINRTNVIPAINVFPMNHPYWSTYQSIKNRNI